MTLYYDLGWPVSIFFGENRNKYCYTLLTFCYFAIIIIIELLCCVENFLDSTLKIMILARKGMIQV